MKVIELKDGAGNPPESFDGVRVEIAVTFYEPGSWDGSGEALLLGDNGVLYTWNMGHCSCYGPWDGGYSNRDRFSPESCGPWQEYFKARSAVEFTELDAVMREAIADRLTASVEGLPEFGRDLYARHDWLLEHDRPDEAAQIASLMEGSP